MSSISLKDVAFSYGSFALSGIHLAIPQGQIAALLGASGSGKSTILRLIAGFLKPSAGEIYLDDSLMASGARMIPAHQRHVGLVFQNYALFPHMRVEDNILFGCRETGAARRQLLDEWLTRLGITHLAARYPHQISGGEQQRVALARALIAKPRVLLLDEPFANLDVELREQVRDECRRIINQQGITTLLVTHDRAEASAFAQKIYTLSGGRLVD